MFYRLDGKSIPFSKHFLCSFSRRIHRPISSPAGGADQGTAVHGNPGSQGKEQRRIHFQAVHFVLADSFRKALVKIPGLPVTANYTHIQFNGFSESLSSQLEAGEQNNAAGKLHRVVKRF
jgi:hypothetical protein